MDKNQAFEVLVNIVAQVNSFNLIQARAVDEAIQVLAKEIEYQPKEEKQEDEVEDLEKSIKKK
ncbi:MAG TPA: hypothetical protein PKN54_05740 [Candidatus Cloacimonas acidaminovorans]|nr:hypothetical protein [Candidatus Cloacimonas acidaminovorans]